jgi:hypothetical protein
MQLPYAEDSNYFQTGKSKPDTLVDRAADQVEKIGGQVIMRGMGTHPDSGQSAFIFIFEVDGDRFRVVWPVLPLKRHTAIKERGAKRQAATFLFYDVKARCVSSAILGTRTAFFSFLTLPDGRVASEAKKSEIAELGSAIFGSEPQLIEGEIYDG